MILIGIDPGLTGAIGMLGHRAEYLDVTDIPTITRQGKRAHVERQVSAAGLADVLRGFLQHYDYDKNEVHAVLEMPIAFPGLHVAALAASFHVAGVIEGVLGAMHLPHTLVQPNIWKKAMKVSRDKEQARAMAVRMFPAAPLSLKKHHNRAEALLLAKYGHELVA